MTADAKYSFVRADAPPQYFLPRRQSDNLGALTFYVRAAGGSDDLMRTARRVVAAADPNLPVSDLMTMDHVVDDNLFTDRLIALMSSSLAALATLLAATGLYGVLAYSVAQRTRELGLRLALGATTSRLPRDGHEASRDDRVDGHADRLRCRARASREALLFGLTGYDPLVLASAIVLLTAVVLAAGYLPARRALSVAPMEALGTSRRGTPNSFEKDTTTKSGDNAMTTATAETPMTETTNAPMISLAGLEKSYPYKGGQTWVLRQIGIEVQEGDFVTIMGPSGSGKSTLLSILGMLDGEFGGEYWFDGEAVHKASNKQRAQLGKDNVGFVFQQFHLLDDLTVAENLDIPLSYRNVPRKERDARVAEILDRFQMVGKKISTRRSSRAASSNRSRSHVL